jgi:hypothetical protein
LSEEWREAITTDEGCRAAYRFLLTFTPQYGVEYDWVIKHAKEQYAVADTTFKGIDDKALTIINYLGGGAGLLTLGSVAGLAVDKVSEWVVLSTLPSFVAAVIAIVYAKKVRNPCCFGYPPTVSTACRATREFVDAKCAEASTIRQWELSSAMIRKAVNDKQRLLRNATMALMWAIILLAGPMLAGVIEKFCTSPPEARPVQLAPIEVKRLPVELEIKPFTR